MTACERLQWILKQGLYVLTLLRLGPTFLWKNQFELIFHTILLKRNRFNSFRAKSLGEKILWQNLYFLEVIFNDPSEIIFFTLMETNNAVPLQIE